MGFVVVTPHVSPPDVVARWGRPMPLGPMKDRRPTGGKVRVGAADFFGGPVRYRFVSLAPVFDPMAVSMVPVPGWTAGWDGAIGKAA